MRGGAPEGRSSASPGLAGRLGAPDGLVGVRGGPAAVRGPGRQPGVLRGPGQHGPDIVVLALGVTFLPPTLLFLVEVLLRPFEWLRRAPSPHVRRRAGGDDRCPVAQGLRGRSQLLVVLPAGAGAGAALAVAYAALAARRLRSDRPGARRRSCSWASFCSSRPSRSWSCRRTRPLRGDRRDDGRSHRDGGLRRVLGSFPAGCRVVGSTRSATRTSRRLHGARPGTGTPPRWPTPPTKAVPAILSGTFAERDALPIVADHPQNLFTALGAATTCVPTSPPPTCALPTSAATSGWRRRAAAPCARRRSERRLPPSPVAHGPRGGPARRGQDLRRLP